MLILSILFLSQSPITPAPQTKGELYELQYSWNIDSSVTAGLLTTWAVSEFAVKSELAPAHCRWCESNSIDEWGRGLRVATEQQKSVSFISDVVDFGVLPAITLGSHALVAHQSGGLRFFGEDLLLVTEATAVSMLATQITKFSVGRQRPFMSQLSDELRLQTTHPEDNNVSFFSGHSSFAFALVVSSGTIATLRNYPQRWLIWTVGLPLALTVPLLRMGADKHYLTDVLIGSLVGGAIGYGVPMIFHGRKQGSDIKVTLSPTANGAAIVGLF